MALTKAKLIELIDNGDIDVGGGGVNPNLLHNWDFRFNPVNQRGATGAISSDYFYDRWLRYAGTITIASGYLSIPNAAAIEQRIEGNALAGKVVTISVMIADVVYSGTGTFPTSAGSVDVTITGFGTATLGYATGYMYVRYTANATRQVQAAKVELGAISTLAYDAPMDYGTELAKCQRYFIKIPSISSATTVYTRYPPSVAASTNILEIIMALPTSMRITPSLSTSGAFAIANSTTGIIATPPTSITIHSVTSTPELVTIIVENSGGMTAGTSYRLYNSNDKNACLMFSAEL